MDQLQSSIEFLLSVQSARNRRSLTPRARWRMNQYYSYSSEEQTHKNTIESIFSYVFDQTPFLGQLLHQQVPKKQTNNSLNISATCTLKIPRRLIFPVVPRRLWNKCTDFLSRQKLVQRSEYLCLLLFDYHWHVSIIYSNEEAKLLQLFAILTRQWACRSSLFSTTRLAPPASPWAMP